MRLTKKKAIELSIELWEWLAETGKHKGDWDGWDKYGSNPYNCFLCGALSCHKNCFAALGYERGCHDTFFGNWSDAKTPKTRKKYANLFLTELRSL